MKHCPACNFSFPDFYRVCDFDGTELVSTPERQALMKVNPRLPHSRPGLKKPMLLTSVAVLGVFLSAVLIGYLESPAPSLPAVVKEREAPNSPPNQTLMTRTSGQLAKLNRTTEPSKRTMGRSRNHLAVSNVRLRQKDVAERRTRNDAIARTRDSKQTSNEKSPKIVAVLKTTWRVLKKPFNF